MKTILASIALIAALIVIIVIVDRDMQFNRYDDVQTAQKKVSVSNRKLSDNVPETPPSTEIKPAPEPQPVETKTVAETKLAKTDHEIEAASTDIIKPAEVKLNKISSFDGANAPIAVPVITAEEAIKANEEALRLYSKKETIAQAKEDINNGEPMALPVLAPEEAIKANKEAIRFQRNKAFSKAFQSFVHRNHNRIHFVLSLVPLLLIFDILLFKKRKHSSKIAEYFSLSRRICILFSVSLLAFGILVFVPWSVYFGNSIQFQFIFQDFVNWNLRVLTIIILGSCIICLLIPPIISDYLVAAIAGLGLCVYVQAMFMNQNLGKMDGNEPVWSEHRLFGIINMLIWFVIIMIPIVLRKAIPAYSSKIISMATGAILFLEILATVSMVIPAGQNVWSRSGAYYVDGTNQFQLSEEKNTVVIIMDALGSGYLEKCFELYPETKELVKDFTWYIDARSNYTQTFPGMCNELTGAFLVAPANNYMDMFEQTWHSKSAKSFYKQVNDAGYDARYYISRPKNIIGPMEYFHDYFSNIEARDVTYEVDYDRLHSCLKQMSAFSFAPFLLKKHFYYAFDFADDVVQEHIEGISFEQKWIPRLNPDFLKKLVSSGITTDAEKPVLSFHYIKGAHIPWIYDEKCNEVEVPFNDPLPTTRGCLYILSEFIHLLKKANIYDQTAILVCADHGAHGRIFTSPCDMAFMVKPFHENKTELSIDEAKVQSIDILPTLLQIICGENADFKDFEGYPSFNVPDSRNRKVYRLARNESFPDFDGWVSHAEGNCLEEYDFFDVKTFNWGTDSKSFIRQIPLVSKPKED